VRKLVAFILILLYFNASTGAPVHVHYCMGKLVSWSFGYTSGEEKCPNCGMHQRKGCCEEKDTILKISEKYKVPTNISYKFNFSLSPITAFENKNFKGQQALKNHITFPSTLVHSLLYKRYCVLLI
jgi:hypothetical protein